MRTEFDITHAILDSVRKTGIIQTPTRFIPMTDYDMQYVS